jgi:hypothetical protein
MSARHIGAPLCDTHERVERRDPFYDEPGPITRADLRQLAIDLPFAVIVFVGFVAFLVILFTLTPGPV